MPERGSWSPGQVARAHVWVAGRVQGVFFRQETRRAAGRAGLSGWVRNLPDGRVEAVFEGPRAAVESLVEWARNGPPAAVVSSVDLRWEDPAGEGRFHVR
ncbi:MAG: acylphosphatase [Actinomycetota bacterium]